jgi:3-oxoacyl-[acyl-carrier protein] reductase
MNRMIAAIHLMNSNEHDRRTRDGPRTGRKDMSMTDTQAKVAVVTGASGGIGRAVALRLARDGFKVVLNYAGHAENAEAAVVEIKAGDGHAFTVRADVADAAEVERLFHETLGALGRIDVVVNCAGIMPMGPIADASLEAFDRVIATNLRGSFIVLAQAAQHVAQGGRIIMFSSSVVAKSFPGYGPYIASKAGVEGLVHVLANELRGREITVNAVAPGPVATELFLKGKSEAQVEQFRKLPPLERIGQPEDIADVVSFLAGPTGGWLNSQVIRANGGFA